MSQPSVSKRRPFHAVLKSLADSPLALRLLGSIAILVAAAAGAMAQRIQLEDIVAGGDGSGNAPANLIGINPQNGEFLDGYYEGRYADSDGVNPSPVLRWPYIDSVFFLGPPPGAVGATYDQQVTQSGVKLTVRGDDATGTGWNFILKNRVGGVTAPGIRVGGRSGFTTSIGLHSSMGITFDLNQLRAKHGAGAVGCFSAYWGMDDCSIGRITLYAAVSSDARGLIEVRSFGFNPGEGGFVSLELPDDARYLTLACGAAGIDNCDHGVFARPLITPRPCPQQTYSWVWKTWPSRVSPNGEVIALTGENLDSVLGARVGGVPLTGWSPFSREYATATTPALAPGFYDLEIIDGVTLGKFVFPGAIEVAPPPVLTAFSPSSVLEDRAQAVTIVGQNLRSDMIIRIDDVGFDGVSLPIDGLTWQSPTSFVGATPRNANGLSPDHRFTPEVLLYDQERLLSFPGLVTYFGTGIERIEPNTVSTETPTEIMFVGLNFAPGMTFRIGGGPIENVSILDSGHARATCPPLPEGTYRAQLISSSGSLIFALGGAIRSVSPAPLAISTVSPSRVYTLGGAEVTITTTRAPGNLAPRVGGVPMANVGPTDGFALRGEIPPLAPGRYDVDLVDESQNVVAVKPQAIEVLADEQIRITSFSPSTVSTLGGTDVTVDGSGFSPGFEVRIGGALLDSVEVLSSTRLRGVSPALEEGLHDASIASARLTLARLDGAATALAPDVPEDMYIGQVRPSRITRGTSRVRFIGTQLPPDVIPRVGGLPLSELLVHSPCRIEGRAPDLLAGTYVADLFRPGFGVVAKLGDLVEVAEPGTAPRPTYLVSEPVQRKGSAKLYVFGDDFSSSTAITIGGKPLIDPTFVSDELIVGRAPPLDAGEGSGLRDIVATDARGSSRLENGLRYVEPEGETAFVRADANSSGRVDLSDAIHVLGYLFLGNPTRLECLDAADADSNGEVALTDAIYLLQFLFLGGRNPAAPYPGCGIPGEGRLGCESFTQCGAGGGSSPSFYENVKLVEEFAAAAADPRVVDIAIEEGEIVIHDPPGGEEIRPGDLIAGFTPVHSEAVHNGVAYMLNVEERISGNCLSASDDDKVFRVRPASLGQLIADGELNLHQNDFFGGKVSKNDSVTRALKCDLFGAGGGGGGGAEQGSGGNGVFFDVDFGAFELLDLRDGDNYLRTGFYQSKVRYNSGINMGVGFKPIKLTRLTFFAGLLLESDIEFYVDAGLFAKLNKEVQLFHLDKGTIIFVGPFPILVTASTSLYAGVNMDAGITMYVDAGASASYKAGLGFEFDGSSIKNISGFEPPTVDAIPDTPVFNVDGYASVKGYIRPEVKVFGGLLFKVLTGDLHMTSEVFGRARVEGHSSPPCFQWGFDAGAKVTLSPRVELFGYKVFSGTMNLINEEWPDLIAGQIGCKYAPVVKIKSSFESVANGILIHLDASGSYDPDGGPLRFRWDFYDDGECIRNTGSDPRTTFRFIPSLSSPCLQERCTHTIRLRVTDDERTFSEGTTSFTTVGEQTKIERGVVRLP